MVLFGPVRSLPTQPLDFLRIKIYENPLYTTPLHLFTSPGHQENKKGLAKHYNIFQIQIVKFQIIQFFMGITAISIQRGFHYIIPKEAKY